MTLAEDGETTVTISGETVAFPRYLHRPGGKMSEAQAAAEAAAFAKVDQLLGTRPAGPRQPGDDDDAPPVDSRTPQQRDQDVDFEALAVKAIARREAERREAEE